MNTKQKMTALQLRTKVIFAAASLCLFASVFNFSSVVYAEESEAQPANTRIPDESLINDEAPNEHLKDEVDRYNEIHGENTITENEQLNSSKEDATNTSSQNSDDIKSTVSSSTAYTKNDTGTGVKDTNTLLAVAIVATIVITIGATTLLAIKRRK